MSKLFKFCFILFAGSCISQDKDLGSRGMGISKKITGSSSGVEYYDEIIDGKWYRVNVKEIMKNSVT